MKQYKATKHSRFNDNDAVIIGMTFEKLEQIDIDNVLKEAKKKSSKIHQYFDWNDTLAAEKFRRYQASNMICSIEIKIIEKDAEVRAYHPIITQIQTEEKEQEKEYLNIIDISKNKEYQEQMLSDSKRELETWYRKWSNHAKLIDIIENEYTELFEEINNILHTEMKLAELR